MPTVEPPDSKLADVDKDGSAVSSRIADPDHALKICNRFVRDDRTRATRRLKVQGAFNGNAPKDHADLVRAGRKDDSNLNFKRHRGRIMEAHSPIFDMVCEVPVCIDGNLNYADDAQDTELMRGFAEYFHELMFTWRGFDDMNQLRDLQMLLHGPGVLAWEDEWDWRPKAVLAGNFYVPSETNGSLDNCEMAMLLTPASAGQLWRKIQAPTQPGWNVEAVKRVIMDSAQNGSEMRNWKWDRWEQAFKNGDLYVSQTQTKNIQLYTLFVEEMDGTISQKIIPAKDGSGKKTEFLFDGVNAAECWDQRICLFPYDIGADGTFHSVKGLGTDIYPFCALLNAIDNSVADLVVSGIKPMWQPATNAKMEGFKMASWGGGRFVPNGINPLQVDISRGIAPGLEVSRWFDQTLGRNTAGTNPQDLSAPTVEETAKSALIRASERAKSNKAFGNRFYRSLSRQYAETWRRAINPKLRKYHPGAKEALRFQARCKRLCVKLGVDWERTFTEDESPTGNAGKHTVLQCVTNIRANRSLGLGSAAMRIEIVNQMMDSNFLDRLDEAGKNQVLRMFASVMTGYDNIDAVVPSLTTGRDPTNDEAVATSENNDFNMLGTEAESVVVPGQNHVLHLGVHVPSMEADRQACEAGQQDPRECQKRMDGKGPHAHKHLAELEKNPTRQREFNEFSARLAELASFQDHLDQTIAEQDQAAAEQPQPGEVTPEMAKVQGNLQLKAAKDQGTLSLKAQNQQFQQQMKAENAAFERRLKDLEAASKIKRETATHQVDQVITAQRHHAEMQPEEGTINPGEAE